MTISDTAQRNHDELFPDHVSTLKVTDSAASTDYPPGE